MVALPWVWHLLIAPAQAPNPGSPCSQSGRFRNPEVFVACAREATDRYKDHGVAVMAGYRLIGTDFPAMGEHWINIGQVFDGIVDPRKPEVLNYIPVDGRRVLAGVAYANPLLPGEAPLSWPAGAAAWHDHTQSIADETLRPHHHGPAGPTNIPRLSMLHVWTTAPNPDGVFAPDNWALSYTRLGLATPANTHGPAARALALATGGRRHFADVINAATDSSRPQFVEETLATAERAVRDIVSRTNPRASLTTGELDELEGIWQSMWQTVDAGFPPAISAHLRHSAIR